MISEQVNELCPGYYTGPRYRFGNNYIVGEIICDGPGCVGIRLRQETLDGITRLELEHRLNLITIEKGAKVVYQSIDFSYDLCELTRNEIGTYDIKGNKLPPRLLGFFRGRLNPEESVINVPFECIRTIAQKEIDRYFLEIAREMTGSCANRNAERFADSLVKVLSSSA